MNRCVKSSSKLTVVHVRLTLAEKEALAQLSLQWLGCQNLSRLMRRLIRDALKCPDVLKDEKEQFIVVVRQLTGIARNFNQLMAAMHGGKVNANLVNPQYLLQIKQIVESVNEQFKDYIKRAKQYSVTP